MVMSSNYVDGAFVPAGTHGMSWTSRSPADRTDVLGEFTEDLDAVDAAVCAARAAQPDWERLGVAARGDALRAFRDALWARQEEIARTMSREVGKPLWEASGEARALGSKVDVTLGDGLRLVQDQLLGDAGVWYDGGYRFRPVGVCAVPGPFNFPLHLANGHIQAALATGNTVVFKPSEYAPRCAELYMQAAHEAGLPAGVLNMVQGGPEAGKRLVASKDVDAVLFTGSVRAGIAIRRETVEQPWKLLALEMGGKNTAIVLSDAELDRTAYEVATGVLLTTGQRCSGTSRVVCSAALVDPLQERLARIFDQVKIGHPLAEDTFMGPLVSEAAMDKYLESDATGIEEGFTRIRKGGRTTVEGVNGPYDGFYVTPALWRAPAGSLADGPHGGDEIFGPDVVLIPADDDDEAIAAAANATEFGLAMAIFTQDSARFESLAFHLRTGILNFNRGTVGASALLPFGGVKNSGNHRPAAVMAAQNCVYPVATLRNPAALGEGEVMARFPDPRGK
jgi:succinylglutamic semialdehyde dehydrogenase